MNNINGLKSFSLKIEEKLIAKIFLTVVYFTIIQGYSCKENTFKKITYTKKDYKSVAVVVKKKEVSLIPLPERKSIFAVMQTSAGTMIVELFDKDAPFTVQNFIDLAQGEKEFIDLSGKKVKRPFYNGLNFHRVIEGFMAQGGCPNGDGTGSPGYKFEDEINAVSLGLDKIKVKELPYYNIQLQKMILKEMNIKSQSELDQKMDEVSANLQIAAELPVIEILYRNGYKYNELINSHKALKGSLAMANSGPDTNGSQFFINQIDTPHLNGLHTVFGQLAGGEDVLNRIIALGNGKTKIINISIIDKR